MKRFLALLLAALMVLSMGACKGGDDKSTEASGKEVIHISFWDENGTDSRKATYAKLIEMFEAKYDWIKIDYTGYTQSESLEKYLAAVAARTTPDTAGIKGDMQASLAATGHLVDLEPYFSKWDEASHISETTLNVLRGRASGKLVMLPRSSNMNIMWYNKTSFENAGVTVPTHWSEWFDSLEALNKGAADGKYAYTIRGGNGGISELYSYIYDYMGTTVQLKDNGYTNINNADSLEFLEKYLAVYGVYTGEDDLTYDYNKMTAAFDNGSAQMFFHNLGSFQNHIAADLFKNGGNEVSCTVLPRSDKTDKTVGWSSALAQVIFDTCPEEKREAAWLWVSFLASHEGNSFFNQDIGQLPVNDLVLGDSWMDEQWHIKIALEAASGPNYIEDINLSYLSGWGTLNNSLMESEQSVMAGKMSAQELLNKWESGLNELIDNHNKK